MTDRRARGRFAVRRAVAAVAVGAATVVGAAAAVNWAARTTPAAVPSAQGSTAQLTPASRALLTRLAADEALLDQLRHGIYHAGDDEGGLPGPLPKLDLTIPSLNLPGVPAGQAPPPTHTTTGASGVAP